MNVILLLVGALLPSHLSPKLVLTLFLSIQVILKLLVFVHPYLGSEGLVGPIVHHAGMWGAQNPGDRSLVCSGLPQLRHSWRLLGNVVQTGARHSPHGRGQNSSPLQKRAEATVGTYLNSFYYIDRNFSSRCLGPNGLHGYIWVRTAQKN